MKKVPWYLRIFAPWKVGQSICLAVEYAYEPVLINLEHKEVRIVFPSRFDWHEQLAPEDDGLRWLVIKAP